MRRTATTAAEGIPYFIQSSQGLLTAFAAGQSLQGLSPDALNAALQADVRAVAFFDQLMFFESQRQLLAAYPPLAVGGSHLTGEEEMLLERVLATGATQIGAVQRDDSGSPFIAFLVPVEHEANGESISGVLLGRARVDVNPILARVLANLQSTRVGGEGFVVDDEGRIVVHPNADAILLEWGDRGDAWDAGAEDGVFERRNPLTNVRELVVTAPVAGYPWTVVLTLPYEVVLYDALRAAWPLLLIQLALSCSVILLAPMLVLPLVRRLRELDDVATRMAEGDLTAPVAFEGRDEFAGLSGALEELRESISDLHADRDFVLNLSSEISRTADTPEGLERILRRLVHDTRARVARLVLASSSNAETVITSEGEPWDGTEEIDRALMNLLQSAEPGLLVVPRVAEYELLDSRKMAPDAPSSLAAHPVWIGGQMSGVMWIGYDSDHEFTAGEMSVLINLATYIRVAIENQRLGASLRAGERELTASLAAISEAVIGIDSEGRINLVNPAAESVLGLDAGRSLGRRFERVGLPSSVSALFKESSRTAGVLDRELWLEDGRRLQARISSVLSELGEQAGCVVALRDVTQIVGSREMRTRFVETFSDHLRTPLTLLQGYATMIPLIGKLSVRQHEYVEKIAAAAIQIKGLVDDLLHLNALESDEGLRKVRIELGDLLVGAVDAARPEAELKEITLRLEPAERIAVVSGNPQLIERAIGNLLDNAIKYTPAGGMVTVTLRVVDGHAVVQVSDTGIGVSKEDQRRLLERFFRVDRPEVMAVPGAGLGLALVKSIVDWHRGKLWVDSEPGRGSAFSVGIPLEPPRSAERGSSDEGPDIDVSGASGSAG